MHDARHCGQNLIWNILDQSMWGGKAMTSRVVLLTGLLICMLPGPSIAQSTKDWVDIKDPKELRALYSNKTFRGNGWVGHYRADGKAMVIIAAGKPDARTWEIKGKDQVCVTQGDGVVNCLRFQRNRKKPNEVILTNQRTGMTLNVTVEDGIPKF